MTLRELRQRRERAEDWIVYASWTAIGVSVVWGLLVLTRLVEGPDGPQVAALLLPPIVAQGLVGYKLRRRSRWAAWVLMTSYGLTLLVGAFSSHPWSGILWKLLIGVVYVRGFLATCDYHELSASIQKLVEGGAGNAPSFGEPSTSAT